MLKDYTQVVDAGEDVDQEIDEKCPFVIVMDERGNRKIVRKSSVCWLLSKDKHKLSSDRLVRVTESDYSLDRSDSNLSTNCLLFC